MDLDSKCSVNPIEENNQSSWQTFLALNLRIGSLEVLVLGPRLLDTLEKNILFSLIELYQKQN